MAAARWKPLQSSKGPLPNAKRNAGVNRDRDAGFAFESWFRSAISSPGDQVHWCRARVSQGWPQARSAIRSMSPTQLENGPIQANTHPRASGEPYPVNPRENRHRGPVPSYAAATGSRQILRSKLGEFNQAPGKKNRDLNWANPLSTIGPRKGLSATHASISTFRLKARVPPLGGRFPWDSARLIRQKLW